jgi:glycosyltransferase involved in cell wall biosynthesis
MGFPRAAARALDRVVTEQSCVDVVIPVFNGQETIVAALNSVLTGQGGWVRRIIVVDDGSRDETAEITRKLGSSLIELVSTPNQGVARARNIGIEKSTAEWVAFLDADDVWMPGKLQAQLAAAQEYGAGFVCGSGSAQSVMPSAVISAKVLARGNFVATSSVLVKRSVLRQIPPVFTPGMSFAEDYLAWLKCVTVTPGYYLSNKLVEYILSERPRYRWGQILFNIVAMNLRYALFLRQIGVGPTRRLGLAFAVFFGSLRSVLSICKRFIRSYLAGTSKK